MTGAPVRVRAARDDDGPFLVEVLALAAAWRPDSVVPTADEVLSDPELAHYVEGWPRPGDLGFVAVDGDGSPIGAAWWRYLTVDDPGYGFVADDVPEIAVGVVAGHRSAGVGTALMDALLAAADEHGLARVSLSVEPDNPARRLYERLGFLPAVDAPLGTMVRPRRG